MSVITQRIIKLSDLAPHKFSGLYHKHVVIVNDDSRVIRLTIISNATTGSITCDLN